MLESGFNTLKLLSQQWEDTTTPSGNSGCPQDKKPRSLCCENEFVGLDRAELEMWGVGAHSGSGLSKDTRAEVATHSDTLI